MSNKNSKLEKDTKEEVLENTEQEKKDQQVEENNEEKSTEEKVEDSNLTEEAEEEEIEEESAEENTVKDDYRDKLVRKIAEFENYKKRTSEEFIRLISTANEELILKLLPIMDDIERFHKNYNENMKAEDLKKAIDLITSKFETITTNIGLKPIDSIGKEFDPNIHDALLQMDNPEVESNYIIDEHEKGYTLNDKVIRHAKVIVSK